MKNYKQSSPINTIYRIKEILHNIGILTKDIHYGQNPFYSCRVVIGNSELSSLNIGTNGKGRSFEYSMASGYAEFLERLQNHILLSKKKYATKRYLGNLLPDSLYVKNLIKKGLTLDYIYDEHEEIWNIQSILTQSKEDLLQLFCINTEEELYRFFLDELRIEEDVMIPFFSVNDNKERLLPIDILMAATASNGMCAGNTREEALIQGFCEIFERYAAKQLYYKEITPPDIPITCFEGTPIYDDLVHLKNNSNYDLIIKDCSLQQGFPVIGVLFIDQINQRYNFKLGSDFVPYIALERCLTELFQGNKNVPTLPIRMIDLKDYSIKNSADYNFQKIIINHSGYWPVSLFSNESSYEFKGFNELYGKSDEEDLIQSIKLIRKQGYNIYIRDNSILGFPTYYIVVPGFSQLINNKDLYNLFKSSFTKISVKQLYSIDRSDARTLAEAIDDNYPLMKFFNYDYTVLYLYNIDDNLQKLEIELLTFMLFYFIGDMDKAKKFIDLFLDNKDRKTHNYYFAISDYISLKYFKNLPIEETKSILEKCYGISITEEVISDLINPDKIFENYQFPDCFNCETCPVRASCSFEHVLTIHKKIIEFAERYQIKQINLCDIVKRMT